MQRERARLFARLFVAMTTIVACVRPAPASAQSLDLTQYLHTAWSNGAWGQDIEVGALVQTPDGFLWAPTRQGLYRFDGVRFTKWQPPNGEALPHESISSLSVAHDGTLWIGTSKGLVGWHDGKLTRYGDAAVVVSN